MKIKLKFNHLKNATICAVKPTDGMIYNPDQYIQDRIFTVVQKMELTDENNLFDLETFPPTPVMGLGSAVTSYKTVPHQRVLLSHSNEIATIVTMKLRTNQDQYESNWKKNFEEYYKNKRIGGVLLKDENERLNNYFWISQVDYDTHFENA